MSNLASRRSSGKGPKYTPPKERGKKAFPSAKVKSALLALGSGTKTVISQHPVMLALGIMTGCTVAKCAIIAMGPKVAKRAGTQEVHAHLGDLYGKTFGALITLAAVPMVTSVAGAVSGVAGALTGKPSK